MCLRRCLLVLDFLAPFSRRGLVEGEQGQQDGGLFVGELSGISLIGSLSPIFIAP